MFTYMYLADNKKNQVCIRLGLKVHVFASTKQSSVHLILQTNNVILQPYSDLMDASNR